MVLNGSLVLLLPSLAGLHPGLASFVGASGGAGLSATAVSGAAAWLLLDLAAYLIHRLYHRVPALWRLHRVHHADRDLDATTAVRHHAGEVLFTYGLLSLLAWCAGIAAGTVGGYLAVLAAVQFLQHANMALPKRVERALGALVLTPGQHAVHHSCEARHSGTNFGAVLSVWDRLFGSLHAPCAEPTRFGLPPEAGPASPRAATRAPTRGIPSKRGASPA